MASMKDVAEKAGVSIATVSHVINGTRFVKKETKQKVLNAMEELNYYPNYIARSLRSQKSNTIGLLVSNISNFFFTGVAEGIENTLRNYGYNLILGNSDEKLENEKKQLKVFNAQMVDGLIMAPTVYDYDYSGKLFKNVNCPVVIFDCKPLAYKGDCVLVDNVKGAYEAVSFLIDKGHRKIGIVAGGLHLTTSIERLDGYKKALLDHGLQVDDSLIKIGKNTRYNTGYYLAKELIEETEVTALFVINNLMTIGVIEFLKENNIKIPEELAIIGFDDYKWASITAPPLTVVKQPVDEIGKKAAELVLKRIKGDKSSFKEYRLPTELIIRDSC